VPKKVLFREDGFNWLRHNLGRRGIRLIEHFETKLAIDRLGLIPTRRFKPRTAVFALTANELTLKVRTTYDLSAKCATQSSNGWVMILDGDKKLYVDRPFNRTENFLQNLLESAALARLRVLHRPNCVTCKAAMDILKGPHPKQRYWGCPKGCTTLPWDEPIKNVPGAMELVEKRRKQHRRTDAKTRARGKEPHQKMFARAQNPPWKVTRPQNRVPPK
jgi:hypothetical protein